MDAIFYFFLDILITSTYIDKNNACVHRTNRHCQFVIFLHPSLNKTSSNYRSDNTYRFCSRGTTGSSVLDLDFRHLCLGRRINTSGHSDFGISSNLGVSSSVIWYMQILHQKLVDFAICKFCNYIHDFCRSHLWRRRSLLCEYSTSVWVIFYNVITEFHTSFVLLIFYWAKWHMFIIEAKCTFLLCLCTSRMTSFLLAIPHGLIDTFIPISFFLSTIHLIRTQILTPVFWILSNEKTHLF